MDDAALVALALEGDLSALARLLRRHHARLLVIGRSMLADQDAAAEVAQETALVAMTQLHRLRAPEHAGPWLAGIARNLCRRRLRRRSYEEWSWESIHGGRALRDVVDPDPTPEEAVVRDEAAASVVGAVGRLPRGQRDAVRLFYLADLSYDEVAAALGIEVNAVKARLHRARRSLRPLVSGLAPTEPGIREEPTMTTAPISLRIRDVRRRSVDGEEQHVIALEAGTGEVVPIWVGPSEAVALALRLTGTATPRPLTYDTMASLVQAADGRITAIALTRLHNFTFYAEAAVEGAAGTRHVDMRPSDALNLALTVDAPIHTTRALLDSVADGPKILAYAEQDFPDDATVIAADVEQQWARMYEEFERHSGT